jgi:hypothetical protein
VNGRELQRELSAQGVRCQWCSGDLAMDLRVQTVMVHITDLPGARLSVPVEMFWPYLQCDRCGWLIRGIVE